jgi:hypothetical protein
MHQIGALAQKRCILLVRHFLQTAVSILAAALLPPVAAGFQHGTDRAKAPG